MKKILITGSSGFIGQSLVHSLKKNKFDVSVISRKDLTIESDKLLKRLEKQKPNFLIHLASHTSPDIKTEKSYEEQIENTLKIAIKTAFSIPKDVTLAIFFGSIEEYGLSPIPYKENDTPSPTGSYGWAKYSSYIAIKSILNHRKIPFLWLRPSLIYGIGASRKRLVGQIFDAYKNNKEINLISPKSKRDFLYIEDLCDIMNKILREPKKFHNLILNISSQNYLSVEEFAGLFKINITMQKSSESLEVTNLLNSNKKLKQKIKKIKFTKINEAIDEIKKLIFTKSPKLVADKTRKCS
jgi:nucleoside-diphosphate-sugar epimerase